MSHHCNIIDALIVHCESERYTALSMCRAAQTVCRCAGVHILGVVEEMSSCGRYVHNVADRASVVTIFFSLFDMHCF